MKYTVQYIHAAAVDVDYDPETGTVDRDSAAMLCDAWCFRPTSPGTSRTWASDDAVFAMALVDAGELTIQMWTPTVVGVGNRYSLADGPLSPDELTLTEIPERLPLSQRVPNWHFLTQNERISIEHFDTEYTPFGWYCGIQQKIGLVEYIAICPRSKDSSYTVALSVQLDTNNGELNAASDMLVNGEFMNV